MNIKDGAIPIAIGKYSRIIISLLVNVILSRILTPEDYGVVAVVTVFTTFFVSLSDVGMGTAIIQMKDLTKDDINSILNNLLNNDNKLLEMKQNIKKIAKPNSTNNICSLLLEN